MLEAAANFASCLNYTDPPYWLTISGKSGCGKSHLAKAIYRTFMAINRFEKKLDVTRQRIYGNTGMFVKWREACTDFKRGGYEYIDDICNEWFVVLDDIGSEHDPSGFIASALDRICNERLNKWTVITTNLRLQDIAQKLDPRIASRMLRNGSVFIESQAQDYALRPQPGADLTQE